MSKKNSMGSDVVEGFACKPKVLDEDKPIMFSAIQLFICDGHRCKVVQESDLAEKVRQLIRVLGFESGKDRVKVTRTQCNGACRFKNFAYVYRNAKAKNFTQDNSFSAWKWVDQWSDDQWKEFILSMAEGKEPESLLKFKV